jgi:hypothetical protein
VSGAPTDFVYPKARQALGTAGIDWATASISAVLLSDLYTPSLVDQFVSAIPPAAILARAVCTNIAITNGICTCLIPQFNSLLSDYICVAVALFIDTGDDTTSQLVYYSSTGNGFPFALQGFNYYVGPDASSGGWFQA